VALYVRLLKLDWIDLYANDAQHAYGAGHTNNILNRHIYIEISSGGSRIL